MSGDGARPAAERPRALPRGSADRTSSTVTRRWHRRWRDRDRAARRSVGAVESDRRRGPFLGPEFRARIIDGETHAAPLPSHRRTYGAALRRVLAGVVEQHAQQPIEPIRRSGHDRRLRAAAASPSLLPAGSATAPEIGRRLSPPGHRRSTGSASGCPPGRINRASQQHVVHKVARPPQLGVDPGPKAFPVPVVPACKGQLPSGPPHPTADAQLVRCIGP